MIQKILKFSPRLVSDQVLRATPLFGVVRKQARRNHQQPCTSVISECSIWYYFLKVAICLPNDCGCWWSKPARALAQHQQQWEILMLFKTKHAAFHFRTLIYVLNFNFPAESTFSGFGIDLA